MILDCKGYDTQVLKNKNDNLIIENKNMEMVFSLSVWPESVLINVIIVNMTNVFIVMQSAWLISDLQTKCIYVSGQLETN